MSFHNVCGYQSQVLSLWKRGPEITKNVSKAVWKSTAQPLHEAKEIKKPVYSLAVMRYTASHDQYFSRRIHEEQDDNDADDDEAEDCDDEEERDKDVSVFSHVDFRSNLSFPTVQSGLSKNQRIDYE